MATKSTAQGVKNAPVRKRAKVRGVVAKTARAVGAAIGSAAMEVVQEVAKGAATGAIETSKNSGKILAEAQGVPAKPVTRQRRAQPKRLTLPAKPPQTRRTQQRKPQAAR